MHARVCVCHGGCRSSPSATAVPSFISQDNLGRQSLPRLLVQTWGERGRTKTQIGGDGRMPEQEIFKRESEGKRKRMNAALLIDQRGASLILHMLPLRLSL